MNDHSSFPHLLVACQPYADEVLIADFYEDGKARLAKAGLVEILGVKTHQVLE